MLKEPLIFRLLLKPLGGLTNVVQHQVEATNPTSALEKFRKLDTPTCSQKKNTMKGQTILTLKFLMITLLFQKTWCRSLQDKFAKIAKVRFLFFKNLIWLNLCWACCECSYTSANWLLCIDIIFDMEPCSKCKWLNEFMYWRILVVVKAEALIPIC